MLSHRQLDTGRKVYSIFLDEGKPLVLRFSSAFPRGKISIAIPQAVSFELEPIKNIFACRNGWNFCTSKEFMLYVMDGMTKSIGYAIQKLLPEPGGGSWQEKLSLLYEEKRFIYSNKLELQGISNALRHLYAGQYIYVFFEYAGRKNPYRAFFKYADSLDFFENESKREYFKFLSCLDVPYVVFEKLADFNRELFSVMSDRDLTLEDLIENPYMLSLYDTPVSSKYGKSSHEIPRVGFDKVKLALSIYAPDKNFSSYQAQAAAVEQVRQAFENGSSYSELSEAVLNVQSPDIVLNDDGTVQLKVVNEMERDISQAVSAVWNKKTVFSGKYIQWGEILSDTGIQEEDRGFIEKQDALYAMQKKKLFFISGRAGTGKTTLVLSYLKGLTGKGIITQNDVMLLAPTGKAADRLKTVTGFQARTIASVLYENGWYVSLKSGFLMKRRNGGKKVRKRIIIVDESSMIDMASFRAVLSTVDLSYLMQVIFVGDKNQLPPVGAGKVFSQLIHELPGNLFELKVVNRFDDQSPQSGLARAVLEGTSKTGMDFSSFAKKYSSVRELGSLILEQISQYEKKREEWIILTPNNIGPFGVNALNLMIKKSIFGYDIKGYNLNERVILLENLPERKVYNGQIGYVEKVFDPFQDEFYIQVSFENGIKANFGAYEAGLLLNSAYAVTIHKAQGSEFENVIVVLPARSRLLSKELIYTAFTRFRKDLRVYIQQEDLKSFIDGLPSALQEIKSRKLIDG